MKCAICDEKTELLFNSIVLNKHKADYFQCVNCKFIQTEEPIWLKEAYSSAIGLLDVGMIWRNNHLKELVVPILSRYFNVNGKFLDYGCRYGLFVWLISDEGFDFYW